jgi:hypothetical protein
MWAGVYCRDVNTVTIIDLNMQNMHGEFGLRAEAYEPNHRIDVIRLTHFGYSASAGAKAAGRGEGISIDGYVHSVVIHNAAIVAAYRGVVVRNSSFLPFGQHASFLFAHDLEVDFPTKEAVVIEAMDRCRFTACYLHGSKTEAGVALGQNVRDAKFIGCNITGHWKSGLYFDGNILDVTSTEFDWNGQEVPNVHHGILLGHTAQNVRIIGGGGDGGRTHHGIHRANPATWVQLAAADGHNGIIGSRNW